MAGITRASEHTPGVAEVVWVDSKGHIRLYKTLMVARFNAHCLSESVSLSLLSFLYVVFP